ncbi:uncharacterized protein LOC119999973 isoform X2 [Tripterygium wilfordii]|uniref:uncharacterized protein LOC119999973 isoform X2 n=1 Tax=Tripterygium wilfordii TaxID=458696 RepID=UPI0018F806B8|nr:uncharacterized protein LOC119999973 isoform X2 [Tripterygium wilfordii]
MQLNKLKKSPSNMTGETPSPSGQWILQEPTCAVPVAGRSVNNVSVQTGEEFSMEFLQDRVAARGIPAGPIMAQNNEKRIGQNFNQKYQMGYEDLARILGLNRMDSECASDMSDVASREGSMKEIENGTYVSKLGQHQKENGDAGNGPRRAFGELNCDRAGLAPCAPSIYVSESPHSNTVDRSKNSDGSQYEKMKLLCSFGGTILPRPSDGKLRYVGGETRIISIRTNLSWEELVKKTTGICNQPHTIKYQLPGEDLDALISVSSDEDLQNMIEEYHGLEWLEGSQRLRIFLIPLSESERSSSLEAGTIQQSSPDYQYVVAVNGISDPSPKINPVEQCLTSLVSLPVNNLERNPNFHKHSPSSPFPLDINGDHNALGPTQVLNTSQNITKSPKQSAPVSPITFPLGDSNNAHTQFSDDNSSIGSSSSFITAQLQPESFIADFGVYKLPILGPIPSTKDIRPQQKLDIEKIEQPRGVHFQNDDYSREFVNSSIFYQNDERSMHNERILPFEMPLSCPEDPMNLVSGSIDSVETLHGIPHAFSDSKLQEHGGRSTQCFLEGTSLSSPLSFSKTQLSPLLVSGLSHEKPVDVLEDVDFVNSRLQNPLGFSPCLETSRSELIQKAASDIDEKCQPALDDEGKSYFMVPSYYEKDLLNLGRITSLEKSDLRLQQGQMVDDVISSAAVAGNTKKIGNCNLASVDNLSEYVQILENVHPEMTGNISKPFVNNLVEHSKNYRQDKTASNILVVDQSAVKDQHRALLGAVTDEKECNVSQTRNPEIRGLSQNPETMLSNSLGLSPTRETTFLDENLLRYPEQKVEKLGGGGSACVKSYAEDVFTQTSASSKNQDRDQPVPLVFVEDVTYCMPSSIQSSSAIIPHVADAISSASTTATEPESVVPESEHEDIKADDQEENDSFSDAVIAEMEANIYGLQIIKNADLEELKELGSGTYGTVYHGKWRGTDVAIKRIKKSCFSGRGSEQERLVKDFWREAHILSNLHHPNVLAFYGVVPDGAGGTLATVTEFMVNGSLRNVLLKKDRSLDRRKKLIIAMDAAFGMEYLHSKNIVHFDLKCDNLLVNLRDPQRPICKVGDFGLSRIKHNTLVSGGVRGTLPWMAPELLNGSSSRVSEKVDVFSFAISMWEILTGEEPYANMHCGAIIGGIVKNTLRPTIPECCDPEWRKLMEQCWSPDPESRPSFTEITNRLRSMSMALQTKGHNNQAKLMPNLTA